MTEKEWAVKKDYRARERRGKYTENRMRKRYWTMTRCMCLKTETRPHIEIFGKLSSLNVKKHKELRDTHNVCDCYVLIGHWDTQGCVYAHGPLLCRFLFLFLSSFHKQDLSQLVE